MNDLHHDIYHLDDEQPAPQAGSLLVAKPTVPDDVFARSVIIIISNHDEEGAMGLIANRITNFTVADVLDAVPRGSSIPVYLGGPVGLDTFFFLHTLGPDVIPGAGVVVPGLFIGGDFDAVKRYLASGAPVDGRIKFFVGYSGWGEHQLDDEIERHDWAVVRHWDVDTVMSADFDTMWSLTVRRLGPRYRLWLDMPLDPQLN